MLERWSSEVQQIVNSEQYKQKIEDQGAFAAYMDGPTLKAFVDKELDAWAKDVKDASIKAN